MPEQTQPSTVLREAASTLRKLTESTSPGPWVFACELIVSGAAGRVSVDVLREPDGRWIAAMSPALAEPLAAWLEDSAARVDLADDGTRTPEEVAELVKYRFGHALAVARVILAANDTARSM